jgi:hypothetical protein
VIVIAANARRATKIRGSCNFTIAARRSNAENVVVPHDNAAVARLSRERNAAQGHHRAMG